MPEEAHRGSQVTLSKADSMAELRGALLKRPPGATTPGAAGAFKPTYTRAGNLSHVSSVVDAEAAYNALKNVDRNKVFDTELNVYDLVKQLVVLLAEKETYSILSKFDKLPTCRVPKVDEDKEANKE